MTADRLGDLALGRKLVKDIVVGVRDPEGAGAIDGDAGQYGRLSAGGGRQGLFKLDALKSKRRSAEEE